MVEVIINAIFILILVCITIYQTSVVMAWKDIVTRDPQHVTNVEFIETRVKVGFYITLLLVTFSVYCLSISPSIFAWVLLANSIYKRLLWLYFINHPLLHKR